MCDAHHVYGSIEPYVFMVDHINQYVSVPKSSSNELLGPCGVVGQ